jgi:hypothetical protein
MKTDKLAVLQGQIHLDEMAATLNVISVSHFNNRGDLIGNGVVEIYRDLWGTNGNH